MEAARAEAERRRLQEKEAYAKRLAAENAAYKDRMGQTVGRDAKALTPEMEAARAEAERRRLQEKDAYAKRLAAENAAYKDRMGLTVG